MGCARMDQRPAERLEELAFEQSSGAMFRDLAGAAGDDVLVAFAAALGVVGRAEAIGDGLDFFENEPIVVERAERDDVVFVDVSNGGPCSSKPLVWLSKPAGASVGAARRSPAAVVFLVNDTCVS